MMTAPYLIRQSNAVLLIHHALENQELAEIRIA
jgi:hypothetical protein